MSMYQNLLDQSPLRSQTLQLGPTGAWEDSGHGVRRKSQETVQVHEPRHPAMGQQKIERNQTVALDIHCRCYLETVAYKTASQII